MNNIKSNIMKILKISGIGTIVILGFVSSCSTVPIGNVGVVNHFGAVESTPLQPGVHFTRPWPFTSIENINTQVGTTEEEALAASKDLQSVKTKVAIQWATLPNSAPQIVQGFGNIHVIESAILLPAVQEVVKAVSARYTAEELITKRHEVKTGIETELNAFIEKSLSEKNASGAIKLANVAVTNFEFSKDFNDSIEAKVKAEQDSLRAENEKKTRVTQAEAKASEITLAAEADAKSKTMAADAQAYTIDAESKARAAALKREGEALSINQNLIQLRTIEQWNGQLPTYTSNNIPLLQLK